MSTASMDPVANSSATSFRRRRIAIVARRYWPHGCSETALRGIALAQALARAGFHVEVATPDIRGGNRGPTMFHRGVAVHRTLATPRSPWTSGRYVRQWTTWIQQNFSSMDLLVAVGGRDESVAMVDAAASMSLPSVVWPTFQFAESDIAHWRSAVSRRRYASSLRRADRMVCDDSLTHRMLVAEGIPDNRIVQADALELLLSATETDIALDREIARQTLASVNADLHATPSTIVVTTASPMIRGGAIESFSNSLMAVAAAFPEARYWIIGDGPARHRLHNQLRGDGLRDVLAMPGTFNDLDDVVAASNVFVHLEGDPTSAWLMAAIKRGCSILIRRDQRNQSFIDSIDSRLLPPIQWCDNEAPSIKRGLKSLISNITASDPPVAQHLPTIYRSDHSALSWSSVIERTLAGAKK